MEETLYFDSRPSTGYNGYYEFYVDTIPENWVGSLNTDADWVLIYRYSKNRYNILVDSNISNSANTEPRSCIISGYFETVADEIYSATTGDSVTITIHQSGYTLPDSYALVPIEITAYQKTTRDWSYIIENCSDELMDYVSAASVSIMYSISDGETKRISPEDIIATSGNSGNFSSAATSVGSPVFSINTESPLEIISGSTILHYFTVPSLEKYPLGRAIYSLSINSIDTLNYDEKTIDITIKSNANGSFAIFKDGDEMFGTSHSWNVSKLGGEDESFRFNVQFASESASNIENYVISAYTTQLYGNVSGVKNFIRDEQRISQLAIRKDGGDWNYGDDITIDSGSSKYYLKYETNYDVDEETDLVVYSIMQDQSNKITNNIINPSVRIDQARSGVTFFNANENNIYDTRSAVIEAIVKNREDIPALRKEITQQRKEKEIDLSITLFTTTYDYNDARGSFRIHLENDATLEDVSETDNKLRNILCTGTIVGQTATTYDYTFDFNSPTNTGWTNQTYTLKATASLQSLRTSKTRDFIRKFNNEDIVVIDGEAKPHPTTQYHYFSENTATGDISHNRIDVTLQLYQPYEPEDLYVTLYAVVENNTNKNVIDLSDNINEDKYLINNLNIRKVAAVDRFQLITSIRPNTYVLSIPQNQHSYKFEAGDYVTVLLVYYMP